MRATFVDSVTVHHFDSIREFADAARPHDLGYSAGWAGTTHEGAYQSCVNGDLEGVADAERLLESIHAKLETRLTVVSPSPCGAYPIVPEYLAGRPDSMRRRVHALDESAPIRVFIDLTCSAKIDHKALTARGIAFLALAMLMARTRPVEMFAVVACTGSNHTAAVIRIPTAPLEIATVTGLFARGAVRTLGYGYLARACGGGGNWLKNSVARSGDLTGYIKLLRRVIGAADSDLVIGPAHYNDLSISDPVKFVQNMIDRNKGIDNET